MLVFRTNSDPEDQALAPKFLSTAANITCTEGDQVCLILHIQGGSNLNTYKNEYK